MQEQKGNALFLILIAVALFAALSYAITQSGRGGGNISREKAAIAASQITQYAASVRTAVQRMVLTGTPVYSVCFGSPNEWAHCNGPASTRVFEPDGGGLIYQCASEDQVDTTNDVNKVYWKHRGIQHTSDNGMYIKDIGTNTDVSGRDAIALLLGVHLAVCQQINKGLGLDQTPAANSAYVYMPSSPTYLVGSNVLDSNPGEAFACHDASAAGYGYAYYHALIEQ